MKLAVVFYNRRSLETCSRIVLGSFKVHTNLVSNILCVRLIPGFSDDVTAETIKSSGVKAVVLLLYGTGTSPLETSCKDLKIHTRNELKRFKKPHSKRVEKI